MGQLTALFYKNWILYKRSLLGNVLEFAIPVVFIMFVVLVRKLDMPTNYSEQSFTSPINPLYYFDMKADSILPHLKYILFYPDYVQETLSLPWLQVEIPWLKNCSLESMVLRYQASLSKDTPQNQKSRT